MTSKIEVPREHAADSLYLIMWPNDTLHECEAGNPKYDACLKAIDAGYSPAPEAPRQEPVCIYWDAKTQNCMDVSPDHSGGAGKVVLPESCDAINAENSPTFMGEPNPHHSIDWYREGIAKHWKTICDQRATVESLTSALTFYADREHYHFESGNWDTVSGEPLNILWCGDEPDFIEDGTVARACLDKVKELNQ